MGACEKTMESQKLGNFSGFEPETIERQRVTVKRAAQRVFSWTVQNEMKNVLNWMTPGSA